MRVVEREEAPASILLPLNFKYFWTEESSLRDVAREEAPGSPIMF